MEIKTCRCGSLIPHQRSFFLLQMETIIERSNWPKGRVQLTMGCPILILLKYLKHSPSSRLTKTHWKIISAHPSSEKLLFAVDAKWQRDPQLVNTQRVRECSSLNGKFIWHSSLQGSGIFKEEGLERLQEPEAVGNFKEIVSSRHSRAYAYVNSDCGSTHKDCVHSSQATSQGRGGEAGTKSLP